MADGVIFRTTDPDRWGSGGGLGTGGNLSPLQFDENMWELLTRIQALENDPPTAVSILSITVVGSQMQVNLTDGSHQGPFALPIATFNMTGDWVNDMTYNRLDMVSVPGRGLYMVLIGHTTDSSPAVFDPAAVDEDTGSPTFGEPLYQLVFGEDTYIYDLGFYAPGKPGAGISSGGAIFGHEVTRTILLPANLTGSVASLSVAPAAPLEFIIKVNGVQQGVLDFDTGDTEGIFTWAGNVNCVVRDRITIHLNGSVDSDATELAITLRAIRTDFQ